MRRARHYTRFAWLAYPAFSILLSAQPLTLSLGPPSDTARPISLAGGTTPPSALQWTVVLPPGLGQRLSATAGPAATSAGKSISCASGAGAFTCIVSGPNRSTIAAGVVAILDAPDVPPETPVLFAKGIASSPDGSPLALDAAAPAKLVSLVCLPPEVPSGGVANCVVKLSEPQSSDTLVTLSGNPDLVGVPPDIAIPAGQTSAAFIVNAGSVSGSGGPFPSGSQTAAAASITATLGPDAVHASIRLLPRRIPGRD